MEIEELEIEELSRKAFPLCAQLFGSREEGPNAEMRRKRKGMRPCPAAEKASGNDRKPCRAMLWLGSRGIDH